MGRRQCRALVRPYPHVRPTNRLPWGGFPDAADEKPNPFHPCKGTLGVGYFRDFPEVLECTFWRISPLLQCFQCPAVVAAPKVRPGHKDEQFRCSRSSRLPQASVDQSLLQRRCHHLVNLPTLQVGRVGCLLRGFDATGNDLCRHSVLRIDADTSSGVHHFVEGLSVHWRQLLGWLRVALDAFKHLDLHHQEEARISGPMAT